MYGINMYIRVTRVTIVTNIDECQGIAFYMGSNEGILNLATPISETPRNK